MKVFPGSFPWPVFADLNLERLAVSCRLANEAVEAEAEAVRQAMGK